MRNFIVAAWEKGRRRRKDLHPVEADTAEDAVVKVVAARASSQEAVYEAWPLDDPATNLRITYEAKQPRS